MGRVLVLTLIYCTLFLMCSSSAFATPSPQATTPSPSAALTLLDNGSAVWSTGGTDSWLNDTVVPLELGPQLRSYEIEIAATAAVPSVSVRLQTNAVFQWSGPNQLPGGAVNLPPLENWSWAVLRGSTVDTSNWTGLGAASISREIPWASQNFTILGTPRLTASLVVDAGASDGTTAPALGFVDSGPVSARDSSYLSLASALNATFVRASTTYSAPANWNVSNASVSFAMGGLASVLNFSSAIGARPYLSVPAGTWGDGNLLPVGMPLNTSTLFTWTGGHATGYLPTQAAYRTYLTTLADDVVAGGWNVTYWNIGNEVPVANTSEAAAFAVLFNTAAAAIHRVLPGALVGSDVLTVSSRIPLFAHMMTGVGFLAFHAYPAEGLCTPVTVFCVPDNVNNYNRDAQVLEKTQGLGGFAAFEAPLQAQRDWHNATGRWLPIIEAETNLNSAQSDGTDPRQQTLFGAAWFVDNLIQSAQENVSSTFFYNFQTPNLASPTATSFFGGWGYGMTAETASGADQAFPSYYAAQLWGAHFRPGAVGLRIANSGSPYVQAYAAKEGQNISLLVDNLAAVATNVSIRLGGGAWHALSVSRLDSTTYRTTFSAANGETVLPNSTLRTVPYEAPNGTLACTIYGYGLLEVTFGPGSGPANTTSGGPRNCPGDLTSPNGNGTSSGGNSSSGNGSSPPTAGGGNQTAGNSTSGQNLTGDPALGTGGGPVEPHRSGGRGIAGVGSALGASVPGPAAWVVPLPDLLPYGVSVLLPGLGVWGWVKGRSVGRSRPRSLNPTRRNGPGPRGEARSASGPRVAAGRAQLRSRTQR